MYISAFIVCVQSMQVVKTSQYVKKPMKKKIQIYYCSSQPVNDFILIDLW